VTDELSPSEVARVLGASTRSVQRWIERGTLPARRVGGRWRVASDAIDAMLEVAAPKEGVRGGLHAIGTVFIANRGEIARRITATCDRLAIRAITPATDGPGALDLLDVGAVVDAARSADADAVHPGYGFLAENAAFAAAVVDAGIRWVGPPPTAIEAMGDKAAARRLATRLGVAVAPGYDGEDQSDDALMTAAQRIEPPLLVKPAAGGGGKGMRVVRDLATFPDAIGAARREATAAFGDDRLILERLIEGPRHVEIQVLFDTQGRGVHLGERDCSIQRRHQKVLEESPSPGVGAALRERLGRDALALASHVGYVGAGTCEFLVDDRGRHSFLEMNTRLQVEHPVTEAVTGRDLVADQLRIAAGEPLAIEQPQVVLEGHAVEVRVYAEDAEQGFLPATGRIEQLAWPSGDGLRVDTGIDDGTAVTGRFDPMLAKVIAHGQDREAALARLAAALDRTTILGLVTNLRFLRWLVREPVVRAGDARIDTLDRIWPPDDWSTRVAVPDDAWSTAAAALRRTDADGWRLNAPARIRLAADDEERSVAVRRQDPGTSVVVAGETAFVDVRGRSVPFQIAPPPDVDRAARHAGAHGQAGLADLAAPMPGVVRSVHARVGDEVDAGDPVVTLEAMKMEHVVAARVAGRLVELLVAAGDQVVRGQVLGSIEAVG
jgi:acetyl-CoA/propionyl-CoA carboxylase biotin carboxyl carrier protein